MTGEDKRYERLRGMLVVARDEACTPSGAMAAVLRERCDGCLHQMSQCLNCSAGIALELYDELTDPTTITVRRGRLNKLILYTGPTAPHASPMEDIPTNMSAPEDWIAWLQGDDE